MKKIVKIVVEKLLYWRWSSFVTICGKGVSFGRSTHISLNEGAKSSQITLGQDSRVFGSLYCCCDGVISIGSHSQVGPGSIIRCLNQVIIGDVTSISTNVIISDNNNHPVNPKDRYIEQMSPSGSRERSWRYSDSAPIVIGNNCWICENSRICKGVTIGDGSVVAANAVVTKDVPPYSIVAGNPAKVVKTGLDQMEQKYFLSK